MFLTMHATLGAGDHAVVVWPAYQSLHEVARSIGADVTLVPLESRGLVARRGCRGRRDAPHDAHHRRQLPSQPDRRAAVAEQLARLISIAELHGAWLFSDEVYRFLEHGAPPLPAAASLSSRALSLGVMSKAFGLAGLRIGWLAVRDRALRTKLASLKDYTTICSAAPSEVLSLIALRARERVLARSRRIIETNLVRARCILRRALGPVVLGSSARGERLFSQTRRT